MSNQRFILGTVQFGTSYGINNAEGKPTKESVFEVLEGAYQLGITQLDSADQYGDAQERIGEFISSGKGEFLVNSKFRIDTDTSIDYQLQQTLSQIKTGKVNVYFYHRFEELLNSPDSLSELVRMKEAGMINKIGVSIYTNEEFEMCIQKENVDVIQIPFNVLDNFTRRGTLIRQAKEIGKEIQVRSIFLQGLFFKEEDSFPPILTPLLKYVRQFKKISAQYGISMKDLALGYVLRRSEIDGIIIGVDSREQLANNTITPNYPFDSAIDRQIEDIIVKEEPLLYPYNWK